MEKQFFVIKQLPNRPDFIQTMTPEEQEVMGAHQQYWHELLQKDIALVFGPVLDAALPYGLGIVKAATEAEVQELIANDPAGRINTLEYAPMMAVVK